MSSVAPTITPASAFRRWLLVWLTINVVDAAYTWWALAHGAHEVGPLAALLLAHGASFGVVLLVKLANVIGLPAWVLLAGRGMPPEFALLTLQVLTLFVAAVVLASLILTLILPRLA